MIQLYRVFSKVYFRKSIPAEKRKEPRWISVLQNSTEEFYQTMWMRTSTHTFLLVIIIFFITVSILKHSKSGNFYTMSGIQENIKLFGF